MKTPPSPAASRTPRASTEEPAAEESLSAHAKRALLARVRTRITAFLDTGIGLLQVLRKKAGGTQDQDDGEDRAGSRRDRPRERQGSAAPDEAAAAVPRPRRRLRAFLIYVSVMLAGGIGGGALAYNQFQKQLAVQFKESQRLEAALAKKTRPSAEIRKSFEEEQARRAGAEKKMAAALAGYAESTADSYNLLESLLGQQLAESRRMEAALADSAKSGADARLALGGAEARRSAAEEKLALSLTDAVKVSTEKQKLLDAAERQLATLLASAGEHSVQRAEPARRRSDSGRPRPTKTGNCTMDTKNVDTLKGCIDDFNQ